MADMLGVIGMGENGVNPILGEATSEDSAAAQLAKEAAASKKSDGSVLGTVKSAIGSLTSSGKQKSGGLSL